ncbi:NO-inducible flavohemoprotein [Cochlodiniinecator piscidefendens]|uniref:NO-inducible flavohemoprotein n=1 Tax=Cochlodiniinecator piscidefendens TaxID=2715756 RepID=UPI00140C496E|nr:NO-inducible flavohemoprotein [Cochlodiniinecator piscidefendens]
MAQALTREIKDIVLATVPPLEEHGQTIVSEMYNRLFENDDIRALFNQSHQTGNSAQHAALANAILGYAKNIDNLEALGPVVTRIVNKHVSLQIKPHHYDHVATSLLGAISAVLGDAATKEVLNAWGEAYWFLADLLISTETEMYQNIAATAGGWADWRSFTISEIITESELIKSFILRPVDGLTVMKHRPGQYLSFDFDIPNSGKLRRNYSISCAPNGEYYRISVKKEPGGIASGWLHNTAKVGTNLQVAAPAGDFFLKESTTSEVVLLSAGVGLTPMVAMLETLAANGQKSTYLHATQNGMTHCMGDVSKSLATRSVTFFENPSAEDQKIARFDIEGRITPGWLTANTNTNTSDYYICGPKAFMAMAVRGLLDAGVSSERINYEFFGPAEALYAS